MKSLVTALLMLWGAVCNPEHRQWADTELDAAARTGVFDKFGWQDELALNAQLCSPRRTAACHETSAGSGVYHLRHISLSLGSLGWLRFASVFEKQPAE